MYNNRVGYFKTTKMKIYLKPFLIITFYLLPMSVVFCQNGFVKKQQNSVLSTNYKIEKVFINSTTSDNLGAFMYKDTLYFSSNEKRRRAIQHFNKDKSYMYDIYYTPINTYQKKVKKLKGAVNTRLSETLPFITKNGKTMYYTANLKLHGKISKKLYILRATKRKGVWGNIEYLSINSEKYSNGQAVLNDAETVMYFVSDRDSKVGGDTDIYTVSILEDGSLGIPKKMGTRVNTSKKEQSPFITKNNELYFSSKGHGGFGGLDVFYIDLKDKNAQAINLGKVINSTADDFSFSLNPKSSKGFLSSNKEGNINIYHVNEFQPIRDLVRKKEAVLKSGIAFYFDFNSSLLNSAFKEALNDLSKELIADHAIKIIFYTHSDSRGTNAYNLILAKKRLESIKSYLQTIGVHKNQINGKALGEENIINKCINDVKCIELEHKKNRSVQYELFEGIDINKLNTQN